MEKHTLLQGIGILKVAYPSALNQQTKEEATQMVRLWFSEFQYIADDVFLGACRQAIRQCKFFPSVSELFEILTEDSTGASAGELFYEVRQAISKYGRYNGREALEGFSEEVRKAVCEIGWDRLCNMAPEERKWMQKEFESILNVMNKRREQKLLAGGLIGLGDSGSSSGSPLIDIANRVEAAGNV